MAFDIIEGIKRRYVNAYGQEIEITHVAVSYRTPESNIFKIKVLPIEEVNVFVNQKDILDAYVSRRIEKEEAIQGANI
ncbi:hypothetical protein [Aneurinibacillus tyrosinisolvens]|uniref:hypothetical protein n=1 Tax=Aneurinibacillus tyrosinisolvens TaxID=1443435 RepID=UPI00063F459A|nr:hypothetical protein [Aneurinibacillus tyrosinisolvens]